jgi:hypothetical protein
MEFLTFICILAVVLIAFKLLGSVMRAGIFLISIPLQIILGIAVTILIVALIPVTLISTLVAVFLLPFLVVGFGIYLLARR